MTVDKQAEPDTETFPIRVLSEKTQVNTVTLRAWERRYGLLKPMRTGKGHRLYTNADVSRVREILAWINRGVSVGQVKSLLDTDSSSALASASRAESEEVDPHWEALIDQLVLAVEQVNSGRIQHLLQDVLIQYPIQLCVSLWLAPVMERLQERRAGRAGMAASGAARALLQSELIRYALLRLEGHKSTNGQSVLLVFGEQSEGWRLAMTALQFVDSGFGVFFVNQACSVEASVTLIQSSGADLSIFLQDGRFSPADEDILEQVAEDKSLYLCGSAGILSSLGESVQVYRSTQELMDQVLFKAR